jgi:hypothetical protein
MGVKLVKYNYNSMPEEWKKENYPDQVTTKSRQTIVPGYNPQNAALAAQYMAQAMGYMPRTPFGSLIQATNPFSISRGMVQRGMPMIAGTNIPFTGAFGPDTRISEIYTEPRRFGKDPLHIKFAVPGQEGPMLGMNWQQQAAQQKQEAPKEISAKDLRRTELDKYTRSSVKGLEDESRTSVRAGEKATKGDIRRGMRQDPNAFYEGESQEGMITPMSDEEYMARVAANRKDVLPIAPRTSSGTGVSGVFEGLDVPGASLFQNPRYNTLYRQDMGSGSGIYNLPGEFAYGGTPMYPDGGFVYNNPVDNRTNPVMSDKDFFSVNTNNNSIPDYLEWQSTPDQEVDVTYQEKNKLNFQPKGLMPFIGSAARNTRDAIDNTMIDKFNTQNMMTSSGREMPTEMLAQGRYDINTGKEIESGFEGIIGGGLTQQTYSKFGGQLEYEEGGEYDLTEEEIQALIDAGVDITLLDDYED